MFKKSLTLTFALVAVVLPGLRAQELSVECGDGTRCYHGSTCLEKVGADGSSHFQCDCSTANTQNHTAYAGRSCEYEATSFCSKAKAAEVGHLFCVNNGTCKQNAYEGCDCLKGFTGFSCEYVLQGGVPSSVHSSETGQSVNGGTQATQICTESALAPGKPLSFCLNHGTCKAKVSNEEPHPGCNCPYEWSGPHCELKSGGSAYSSQNSSNLNKSGSDNAAHSSEVPAWEVTLLVLSIIFLVAILVCALRLILRYRPRKADITERLDFATGSYRDEPNISPYRDSATDPIPNHRHTSSSSDHYAMTMIVEGEKTRQVAPTILASEKEGGETLQAVEIC